MSRLRLCDVEVASSGHGLQAHCGQTNVAPTINLLVSAVYLDTHPAHKRIAKMYMEDVLDETTPGRSL